MTQLTSHLHSNAAILRARQTQLRQFFMQWCKHHSSPWHALNCILKSVLTQASVKCLWEKAMRAKTKWLCDKQNSNSQLVRVRKKYMSIQHNWNAMITCFNWEWSLIETYCSAQGWGRLTLYKRGYLTHNTFYVSLFSVFLHITIVFCSVQLPTRDNWTLQTVQNLSF